MAKTLDKDTVLVRITAGSGGIGTTRTNVWLSTKLGLGLSTGYLLTGGGTRMSRADAVALLLAARLGHPQLSGRTFAADEDLEAEVEAALKVAEKAKAKAEPTASDEPSGDTASGDSGSTGETTAVGAGRDAAASPDPSSPPTAAVTESAAPRARHQR